LHAVVTISNSKFFDEVRLQGLRGNVFGFLRLSRGSLRIVFPIGTLGNLLQTDSENVNAVAVDSKSQKIIVPILVLALWIQVSNWGLSDVV
jgi:hypothetical protein